ncbi:FHA domain-containing protein [Streptomyces sp. NPDC055056]
MEHNLARSVEQADCLVDLSVVVRKAGIAGQAPWLLRRIDLTVAAMVRRTGDPDVSLYLIADDSLLGGRRRFADPREAQRLKRWVALGLVEQVPDADVRVLELAGMTGLTVVTDDTYTDARDEHPWLQGNDWQFLRPVPARGGVDLVPLDMGVRSSAEVSHKAELAALKKQGLLDSTRAPLTEVVRRSWKCPARGCSLYDASRGQSVLLPRMRAGSPTCEIHATPLLDDGPRAAAAQLKLLLDGSSVGRFTLDSGSTVQVGRAPGEGGLALQALVPADRLDHVSRAHVEITADEEGLRAKDISSYGSRFRRSGRKGSYGPWTVLPKDHGTGFRPGDEIELAPGVVLARSGRRFPTELSRAWQQPRPKGPRPDPAAVTRPWQQDTDH